MSTSIYYHNKNKSVFKRVNSKKYFEKQLLFVLIEYIVI